MKLILARHGESAWNRQGIIQGQLDSPLTSLGVRQVVALRQALAHRDIVHIYSSPAIRATASAELLMQQFECEITLDIRLHERHYGTFQGKEYTVLKEKEQEWGEYLWFIPSGGESIEDVCERLLEFIHDLDARYSQETVLVVTHGDVLTALIWHLKGCLKGEDLRRYTHHNASFAILELTKNGIQLENWGVGTHLLNLKE